VFVRGKLVNPNLTWHSSLLDPFVSYERGVNTIPDVYAVLNIIMQQTFWRAIWISCDWLKLFCAKVLS